MPDFPSYTESETQALNTILDWIRWSSSRFSEAGIYFGHGTDNPWDEAIFLVSWAIHQPWDGLDRIANTQLTDSEKAKIYGLVTRRIQERIPAPYLTGVAWFGGYPFKVTQDVLVPRSPIAELIMKDFEPWLSQPPQRILDMCTGSGCIGISCAHQYPDAEVVLSDISEAALGVANQNIDFHNVGHSVSAVLSDGFEALDGQKFDLIVSNPPYVDAEDLSSMPQEFHAEPPIGLSSGDDGLDFTRKFLAKASQYLNDNGIVVVEVGNSWVALEEAYPNVAFTWPELEHGGHGVFILTKEQLAELS